MQKAFEESFPALDEKTATVKDADKVEDPEKAEEAKDEKPVEEEQNSDIDDERTGGEWVTTENLYKHISKGDAEALIPSEHLTGDADPAQTKYIEIKPEAP